MSAFESSYVDPAAGISVLWGGKGFRIQPCDLPAHRKRVAAAEQREHQIRRPTKFPLEVMLAIMRLRELVRIAEFKREFEGDLGDPFVWLTVLADALAVARQLTYEHAVGYLQQIGIDFTEGDIMPALDAVERRVEARRVLGEPYRMFRADVVARKLDITAEAREWAGAKTIGAIDETREERQARRADERRARDRQRKRQDRLMAGATPRERSKAQTKPWEAMGISRSTYYARGLHEAAGPSRPPTLTGNLSRSAEQTVQAEPNPSAEQNGHEEVVRSASALPLPSDRKVVGLWEPPPHDLRHGEEPGDKREARSRAEGRRSRPGGFHSAAETLPDGGARPGERMGTCGRMVA
jgi:hypothetical protein